MPLMARLREAVEETVHLQRRFLEEEGAAVVAAARMLAGCLSSAMAAAPRTPNIWPRSSSTASRWSGLPWRLWP